MACLSFLVQHFFVFVAAFSLLFYQRADMVRQAAHVTGPHMSREKPVTALSVSRESREDGVKQVKIVPSSQNCRFQRGVDAPRGIMFDWDT